MIYSRCRCGDRQHWGSGMKPPRCTPCKKCGTVPATGPNSHPEPVPHDFRAVPVAADQAGATLTRCMICLKTKAEIDQQPAGVVPS